MHHTLEYYYALLEQIDLEIGGHRIDRQYGLWLDIWNELTDHEEADWLGLNKHSAKKAYLKSNSSLPL